MTTANRKIDAEFGHASYCFPPPEFCFGTSPIQAEKSRPYRNAFGSATLATRAVANGPHTGKFIELPAHLIRAMPGHNHSVELQNLRFEHSELSAAR